MVEAGGVLKVTAPIEFGTLHMAPQIPEHHAGALEIYALHPHRRFVPTMVRALIDFLGKRLNPDGREDPWG